MNYTVAVVTPVDKLQTVADILNFPANPPTNNINPIIAQAVADDAARARRSRG